MGRSLCEWLQRMLGAVWLLSPGAGRWELRGVPPVDPQQGCPLWLLMAVVGCCTWKCLCLSLEKGAGSASALAETTPPLNVLLFLPVLHAAQPSLLCLDLSFPGLSQKMREAPEETMV